MSKRKASVGTSLAQEHIEQVKEHNRKMRETAIPAVRDVMDQVQTAIDAENSVMDVQFEGDAKLRKWAKELLGYEINMSQIEELQTKIKKTQRGQVFVYHDVALIRTQFDTVDRAANYLFALEKTIIDLSNKTSAPKQFSVSAEVKKDPFTDVSTFGLIKLAFKRLFNRSK